MATCDSAGGDVVAGELSGKVALITGAGQGIGRAFALGFAQAGAAVLVSDVLVENAERTAQEIQQAGGQALGRRLDVSKRAEVEAAVDAALEHFGRLDILLNNAGIFPRAAALELDDATWDAVLSVNLKGTFLCSQAAARVMVDQGQGGRIVNLASRSAYQFTPRATHYAASKAGIVAYTRNLAVELTPYQITVNAIAPGYVDTEMVRAVPPDVLEKIIARIPRGRLGTAQDIARGVAFLTADDADFITGSTLSINGGQHMY